MTQVNGLQFAKPIETGKLPEIKMPKGNGKGSVFDVKVPENRTPNEETLPGFDGRSLADIIREEGLDRKPTIPKDPKKIDVWVQEGLKNAIKNEEKYMPRRNSGKIELMLDA